MCREVRSGLARSGVRTFGFPLVGLGLDLIRVWIQTGLTWSAALATFNMKHLLETRGPNWTGLDRIIAL